MLIINKFKVFNIGYVINIFTKNLYKVEDLASLGSHKHNG